MRRSRFHHHNHCPRCPILGAEDVPGDEYCQLLSLRFDLQVARELSRDHESHLVHRAPLEQWLRHADIDREHVGHLPRDLGPGIMITLPAGCGMPLIDGNHRAARALHENKEFLAFVLSESETLELLRRSIGRAVADDAWNRMLHSKPHPDDVPEGAQQ
jgi:hypothetical protein